MLHKVDPDWTCAYEEEDRYYERCWKWDPNGGFWGDEYEYPTNKPPAWMPESARWTDEDEARARAETDALLEAHPELKHPPKA
jgi:hypothetical protein